ncbi:MAG: Nramp family divalent metal transporter [Trueperaceae bacterium]|nr:Nramp family divalent metal transporter [Trueperaceae bacterium]
MPSDQNPAQSDQSIRNAAQDILELRSTHRGLKRILPFLGPAFIAAVAYIDPGNFATNIEGGSRYGYRLLWVVLAANLMAMLIQALSAKLGIATGKNLPELIRDHYPRPVVWLFWVQAELVAIATDLAEFLGAAIGFQLLFGLPLFWGGVLTGIATFALLGLQRYGFRPLEAVIAAMVATVAGAYLVEVFLSKPNTLSLAKGFIPSFSGSHSIYLAAGILGATVMPHVIYLHSALTQRRIQANSDKQRRRLYRYNLIDVVVGMSIAGFVNMAMLAMAAATFYFTGQQNVAEIETAYQTLSPLLGSLASGVFAFSLLISGLSSSTVGTMAGQIIMQGFVHFTIPLWLRRLITMLPAMVVIIMGLEPTAVLVLSQVVLSFGIPFALLPLLQFTRKREVVGVLANSWLSNLLGWLIASIIIALNVFLLVQLVNGQV